MNLCQAFVETKNACEGTFNLTGDVLLVEKLIAEEHKKDVMGPNGKMTKIYLSGGTEKKIDGLDMNLPMFVKVLAVGPGFYNPADPAEAPIGCEVEIGDIILIGRMSVNWFSVFGSLISTASAEIGITRESEVRMRFKGQYAYDNYFKTLNEKLSPHAQEEKAV